MENVLVKSQEQNLDTAKFLNRLCRVALPIHMQAVHVAEQRHDLMQTTESSVKSCRMACEHEHDIIAHLLAGDAAGPGILRSASRSNPTIFASYPLTCE